MVCETAGAWAWIQAGHRLSPERWHSSQPRARKGTKQNNKMPASVKNVLEEVFQISSLIKLWLCSACLSNILCKEIGSMHQFFQCTQKCYFFGHGWDWGWKSAYHFKGRNGWYLFLMITFEFSSENLNFRNYVSATRNLAASKYLEIFLLWLVMIVMSMIF